ncbi:MAG TPA: hypothetical protein VIJ02_09055 [Thermoanaerobaculia bacterium]|jgi:hypothetical protein
MPIVFQNATGSQLRLIRICIVLFVFFPFAEVTGLLWGFVLGGLLSLLHVQLQGGWATLFQGVLLVVEILGGILVCWGVWPKRAPATELQ